METLAGLSATALVELGPWGLLLLFAIYVVTGFTHRGWTTQKQRDRQDETLKQLNEERKTALATQSALVVSQQATIHSQQGTISSVDGFFTKVPVRSREVETP